MGPTQEPSDLARRCQIHAAKMDEEGHYVTSNVLFLAANELYRLEKIVAQIIPPPDANKSPDDPVS